MRQTGPQFDPAPRPGDPGVRRYSIRTIDRRLEVPKQRKATTDTPETYAQSWDRLSRDQGERRRAEVVDRLFGAGRTQDTRTPEEVADDDRWAAAFESAEAVSRAVEAARNLDEVVEENSALWERIEGLDVPTPALRWMATGEHTLDRAYLEQLLASTEPSMRRDPLRGPELERWAQRLPGDTYGGGPVEWDTPRGKGWAATR